jgi:hypothetical protein
MNYGGYAGKRWWNNLRLFSGICILGTEEYRARADNLIPSIYEYVSVA